MGFLSNPNTGKNDWLMKVEDIFTEAEKKTTDGLLDIEDSHRCVSRYREGIPAIRENGLFF